MVVCSHFRFVEPGRQYASMYSTFISPPGRSAPAIVRMLSFQSSRIGSRAAAAEGSATWNGSETALRVSTRLAPSARSTSNGLPMLFPARSSIVVWTTTEYRPPRHAVSGTKVQRLSRSSSAGVPATSLPSRSTTRIIRRASAWSIGSPNATVSGAFTLAAGGDNFHDSWSGGSRSGGATAKDFSNPFASGIPAASFHAPSMTSRNLFPATSAGPTSSSGSTPRLIRPGSMNSVRRFISGSHSSSSISRNGSSTVLPDSSRRRMWS